MKRTRTKSSTRGGSSRGRSVTSVSKSGPPTKRATEKVGRQEECSVLDLIVFLTEEMKLPGCRAG